MIEPHNETVDIDLTQPEFESQAEEDEVKVHVRDLQFQLGQKVTVIEGTGSATKQWSGVVVEVEHYV